MTITPQPCRFLHNREIAPEPSWQRAPVVPLPRFQPGTRGMSEASRVIAAKESDIWASYSLTQSFRLPPEFEFNRLVAQWKRDTYWDSSVTQKILHPCYQQIIGMGPQAVGWILRALRHEPDFWFDALTAITGEQPVPYAHAGDLQAMADDWLQWGRRNGYEC